MASNVAGRTRRAFAESRSSAPGGSPVSSSYRENGSRCYAKNTVRNVRQTERDKDQGEWPCGLCLVWDRGVRENRGGAGVDASTCAGTQCEGRSLEPSERGPFAGLFPGRKARIWSARFPFPVFKLFTSASAFRTYLRTFSISAAFLGVRPIVTSISNLPSTERWSSEHEKIDPARTCRPLRRRPAGPSSRRVLYLLRGSDPTRLRRS